MKQILAMAAVGIALMGFSAPASAISLGIVGSEDVFIDAGNIANSNPVTELGWIATALGVNVSTLTYTQLPNSGGSAWLDVTGEAAGKDLWAWDFGTAEPVYFMVKTGNNTGIKYKAIDDDVFNVFLFSNSDMKKYGVIDLKEFFFVNGAGTEKPIDIFRISHIGETGTAEVPEPGTFLLIGSGLLGLGLLRRTKNIA